MQDIRSFFNVVSKKPAANPTASRKRPIVIGSSDEDVIDASPAPAPKKRNTATKKHKAIIIDSDSDEGPANAKISSKNRKTAETLKPVNISEAFGNEPVKQAKVEVIPKPPPSPPKQNPQHKKRKSKKLKTELGVHDDPDFEKTLLDLDGDLFDDVSVLDRTIEEALKKEKFGEGESVSEVVKNESKIKKLHKNDDVNTSSHKLNSSEYGDEGIDKDQERYERKRHSAALYQKYLNRSGPARHGSKELPKGKPDCLKNVCFLRTGVLDSLESEEFEALIKEHGGRTVSAVSRKVNYLVVGDEPGPAKLEKAHNYGIKTISEDELLDMILLKSGLPSKYTKKDTSCVNETGDNVTTTSIKNDESDEKIDDTQPSTVTKKVLPKEKKSSPAKPEKEKILAKEEKPSSPKAKNETKLPQKVKSPPPKSNTDHLKIVAGKDLAKIDRTPVKVAEDNLAWTDKYKPKDIKGIIGQQGDKSNMRKLLTWLKNWHNNQLRKNKLKLSKPSPWAKDDNGAYFKCALLSGPPGVGKTTTSFLVAKELGFDVVEFNASDTRSKKLLHEEVSQLLSTNSIASFVKDGSAPTTKRVLLMDEVDGMAGNEDRGGMQELIALIKNSSVPIICMCNDRQHTKVRSLANHCFDLKFARPRLEQIKGAMMSVCFKEGLKIDGEALNNVINGAGMDMRQILNHLSMWTATEKTLSSKVAENEAKMSKRDTPLGPWEVIRKVFSADEHKNMSLIDRSKLFFYDYSIGPLFVQENYLHVVPHCPKSELLERIALTADSISMSDLIDSKIRSTNNWSLLEVEAMYASVLPGFYMSGHIGGQINFPGWLGKNSKRGKFQRLLSELQAHMRTSISASRTAVNLDYICHLRNGIVRPLVKEGSNGVQKSISFMHSYNLTREDLDSLLELAQWPKLKDPMSMVDSKVKSAFTRTYNKDRTKLPYSLSSAVVKKKTTTAENEIYGEENEEEDSSPEDNDDVSKDAMIKTSKAKKETTKASTSKKPSNKAKGKKPK